MNNPRRIRSAADVALGYAADSRGSGIAYASIATGNASRTLRLTFTAKPAAALEGRENGYAAIAALAAHLKNRGIGRVRIRIADERVANEVSGVDSPPKALSMDYVRVRCLLHALGSARVEAAQAIEVRDLMSRASAEVSLHAAA